ARGVGCLARTGIDGSNLEGQVRMSGGRQGGSMRTPYHLRWGLVVNRSRGFTLPETRFSPVNIGNTSLDGTTSKPELTLPITRTASGCRESPANRIDNDASTGPAVSVLTETASRPMMAGRFGGTSAV